MKDLERCGFCGRFFVGDKHLTTEELNTTDKDLLDKAPLGYCPDSQQEYAEQNPQQRVTRDMAIDCGDLSLEGQWI